MASNNVVLVAGGAGFIGSHLCRRLLDGKNTVICVDSLITGKKENVKPFLKNKNFKFVHKDICALKNVSGKITQVYNLASPASPVDYQKRPLETLNSGSDGVKRLLEISRNKKASFLQASTSEVYGDPLEHPQKETYYGNVNPIGPRACYDESKRFAEALIVNYSKVFGTKTRIARIFNTYGPQMRKDDGRVIPNFFMQALSNKPITVYGEGKQTRSFCYVDDLVFGLELLMGSDYSLPVNLGNQDERTILETAQKIISITGSTSGIKFLPLPKDDPERRKPDISIAKKVLGWEPKTGFDEGLLRTINWFSSTSKKGRA